MEDWIRVLVTPSCWVQNYSYSRVWDMKLQKLLDNHKFVPVRGGSHINKLGEQEVWTANHPYASMRPYSPDIPIRPSRITMLKAHDRLIDSLIKGI